MAKNMKRILAMFLVMAMFVSVLPMQALAAEGDPSLTITDTISGDDVSITFTSSESEENQSAVKVTGTNESGSTVNLDGVATTTSKPASSDSNGNVTEVTTEVHLNGYEYDGTTKKTVVYDDKTVTTTTEKNDGTVSEKSETTGTETKSWDEKIQPGEALPEVDVTLDLKQDSTESETDPENQKDTVVSTASDVNKEGKSDTEEGETTTTINREVKVEVKDVAVTVTEEETDLIATKPDLYEGKDSSQKHDSQSGLKWKGGDLKNGKLLNRMYADDAENKPKPDEEGFDYQHIGTEETTDDRYRVDSWNVIYKTEDGEIVKDENGNPVVEGYAFAKMTQGNMMVLRKMNEETGEEELVYTYCLDNGITAGDGYWYKVTNLEDSDYFATEDAENHIRGIVTNGYWGTEKGVGSLDYMVQQMRETLNGDEEIVVHFGGEDVPFKIDDILDGLIEGEALSATQAAIWSYANGIYRQQLSETGRAVDDSFSNVDTAESLARVRAVYHWLLEREQAKDETSVVINDTNFLEEMTLSVGDMATGFEQNLDENKDNDVYNVDLQFKLDFELTKEDCLKVSLTDAEGNHIKDANGNEIVIEKNLAVKGSDRDDGTALVADENGVYTLSSLQLSEQEDISFALHLEGTQQLATGVYVFTPYGDREDSQTMVSLASGTQQVNVSAGMTVNFDVNESKTVSVKHTWHDVYDPGETPEEPVTPPDVPNEPDPVAPVNVVDAVWVAPENQRLANDEVVEIPEEPVPLAVPANTGDNSGLWIMAMLLIACGMVAINVLDKKRNHETF